MCGIAAVVGGDPRTTAAAVERMLDALEHRGPDGRGTAVLDGCVLGSTRLAVVDPPGSDQPLAAPASGATVVFNGEVYGHRRFRDQLAWPWRTRGDTEVLLALHARHGEDLCVHLPGMFAFALWDAPRRRLLVGRDRFGEKPLYWCHGDHGEVVVASELKAVVASGLVTPHLDPTALGHVLRQGWVPADRSIYRNVSVLPPAHRLVVSGEGALTQRYSHPPAAGSTPSPPDATTAADQLRAHLDQAVADQLVSDVPVGAFLSGGLDSSIVTALAAAQTSDLRTFSFVFDGEEESSEEPFARLQAERSGTWHRTVRSGDLAVADLLRRLQAVWDEPFADSSALPTYLLCQAAREEVTVVLTGDGADELLGGYLGFSRSFLTSQAPEAYAEALTAGPIATDALARAYVDHRRYLSAGEESALGLSLGEPPVDLSAYATGTLEDVLRFDLDTYLPGDVLVKTDRASMAHGLELRSPFLDVHVASFCLSLPTPLKVTADADKVVLREAAAGLVAPEVIARPKQGFGGPLTSWWQRADLLELRHDLLDAPSSPLRSHVDGAGLDALLAAPVQDWRTAQQHWNLLVAAAWLEAHPISA
jgi:asparagine synthase (glutamine-hydrolysing)